MADWNYVTLPDFKLELIGFVQYLYCDSEAST